MTVQNPPDTSTAMLAAPEPVTTHHGFGSRIRNYFLTGLIVAGPVAITIYLIWSFVTWVDDLVRPFIPVAYRPETYFSVKVPGFGLIIAFLALTLLGFLTANLVGRKLVEYGERTLGRIEFPAPGMWSLVFLSTPPGADITVSLPGEEHVSVFMPCTPNPTTGFFFYVPRRAIIELDIPVEAAAKLIMTAGMIQPGGNGDAPRNLAALAEQARA